MQDKVSTYIRLRGKKFLVKNETKTTFIPRKAYAFVRGCIQPLNFSMTSKPDHISSVPHTEFYSSSLLSSE